MNNLKVTDLHLTVKYLASDVKLLTRIGWFEYQRLELAHDPKHATRPICAFQYSLNDVEVLIKRRTRAGMSHLVAMSGSNYQIPHHVRQFDGVEYEILDYPVTVRLDSGLSALFIAGIRSSEPSESKRWTMFEAPESMFIYKEGVSTHYLYLVTTDPDQELNETTAITAAPVELPPIVYSSTTHKDVGRRVKQKIESRDDRKSDDEITIYDRANGKGDPEVYIPATDGNVIDVKDPVTHQPIPLMVVGTVKEVATVREEKVDDDAPLHHIVVSQTPTFGPPSVDESLGQDILARRVGTFRAHTKRVRPDWIVKVKMGEVFKGFHDDDVVDVNEFMLPAINKSAYLF